jgi:serine phosphatase RsbU (regulator of sigma subunit)
VGRAATSSLEHADVVQVVTDAATAMTGAQFGAFFYNVIGERGESYALYTISGVPREAFSKFPMPRNTEIFGPTFNGEGVVRLDDVTADPRYGRLAPHHGMPKGHLPVRSYLAVPVKLSDGEVIGGLFFGHEDVGVFGDNAERLAVGIAAYAAIALENGRLYDAARRESREKEAVAAALERPLQPPELPEIPGVELAAVFRPFGGTGQLGGDFYDVFPLGRERWVLALGDVAGKGPEAAAITGLVRHTLWGAAQFAADPASVAAAVNANLFRQSSERFATLVVAVLTPGPDAVTVDAVWAGHPPALLVGREGDRIVHADGVPIGMFSELRLGPVRLVLQPGEMLLVYTDGLLERQGAVLNEQAVLDAVHAQQQASLDAMLEQVVAEIGAEFPARDDVAAVALRVRPPS